MTFGQKSALIIVHHGFTDSEFLYAYHRLLEEKLVVSVATLDGQDAVGDKGIVAHATTSTSDFLDRVHEFGIREFCSLLILPGGVKSIEKVRQDASTIALTRFAMKSGIVVAAICHGSQILIEADAVRGRRATGYYSIRKDLLNAGAIVPDDQDQPVVLDLNLVTSPHYKWNHLWMKVTLNAYYASVKNGAVTQADIDGTGC